PVQCTRNELAPNAAPSKVRQHIDDTQVDHLLGGEKAAKVSDRGRCEADAMVVGRLGDQVLGFVPRQLLCDVDGELVQCLLVSRCYAAPILFHLKGHEAYHIYDMGGLVVPGVTHHNFVCQCPSRQVCCCWSW